MKAFYCVGTHWDREWYEPFQEFRMWLVELIDDLLDRMERDPGYRYFHLDGQTIVLEDYFAVRPENRERLLTLIRSGRILVGPWYNLPDEFLVSGESLIRNLLKGRRVCRELAIPSMRFAYTPDQFGHIAALPLIMAGFDLPTGLVWRGTQDETTPAHFVWEGPDGSALPVHKLMDRGSYGVFDFEARGPIERAGLSDESYRDHFEPYLKDEAARSPLPYVLLLDAIDHQAAPRSMPGLLDELKRRYPDIEIEWSTLEQYAEALTAHTSEMPRRRGELREPRLDNKRVGQYLIVHTLSSRYPLKAENDRCAALLERWVEPYAVFQRLAGGTPILRYLDMAWTWLLKNHPHDSICGCSIDQVHQDMVFRFDQCRLIGDGMLRRALAFTGSASDGADDRLHFRIHNPLPFERKGVFDIVVPIAQTWASTFKDGLFTAECVKRFRVQDHRGGEIPFQIRRVTRGRDQRWLTGEGRYRHEPDALYDEYTLAIETTLPPSGHMGITIVPTERPMRNSGSLRTGPLRAANEYFACSVAHDGTVTLTDLASGRDFGPLFVYEDRGDTGDGWTWGQCIDDRVVVSSGARVTVAVEEDGPLRCTFRIERVLDIPKAFDTAANGRSEDATALRIVDRLSIERDAHYLRVHSTIHNTALDHRLRVLFDSGVDTDESFADSPFVMVSRPIAAPDGSEAWEERHNPEKPFSHVCGVADDRGGIAILSPSGLKEYAVLDTPARTVALTLFRAFRQTVMTHGEPGGQLQGVLEYDYALLPFRGPFPAAAAQRTVAALAAGIRLHPSADRGEPVSYLRCESESVVVTAIKPDEEGRGFVLRLWNPTPSDDRATLHVGGAASYILSRLDEAELGDWTAVPPSGLVVAVGSGHVCTLRFAYGTT